MALALYGASALVLQHREQITSLLGQPREDVVTSLLRSAVQTLSAALFLIYYVELSFRTRNLLVKENWRDLGLWATKLGFIVLSVHILAYRCQQECDTRLFRSFEDHFHRTQWYIRLFAAAASTANISLAGLLGTWSLLFRSEEEHPSKMLGSIPSSIAEALGLKEGLVQLRSNTAAALVGCINAVICPLMLVYGLWALWLPQLPLLQHFYAPFAQFGTSAQEL